MIAGEPSGDVLGGRLIAALKAKSDSALNFVGVGGDRMIAEGLESLFDMQELSVMGYLEVVPRLPGLIARLRETTEAARKLRPDAVVTIDSPDFTFRVARKLKGLGIPLIHYVAPQVWAHRPWRAAKIAGFLDHILALLPFEPPLFEAHGLACTYVGHAIVEEGADAGDGPGFRLRHGIPADAPLIAALPGSRHGEVSRHLPIFGAALGKLAVNRPGLRAVVPTVAAVAEEVARGAADWPVETLVITGGREKYHAFAAADAALAASGTVALELAIAALPTVIAYKANALTAWAARRMILVPYVCLVNLILDQPAVPEFLQDRCRPDLLAEAVAELLDDAQARAAQIAASRRAVEILGHGAPGLGGDSPSARAATAVLEIIAKSA